VFLVHVRMETGLCCWDRFCIMCGLADVLQARSSEAMVPESISWHIWIRSQSKESGLGIARIRRMESYQPVKEVGCQYARLWRGKWRGKVGNTCFALAQSTRPETGCAEREP
jgi:hypothetical protein